MKRAKWRLRCAMLVCFYLSLGNVIDGVTITPLTKSVKLDEKEKTSKQLGCVSCAPTAPATTCTISIATVYPNNPCANCFGLYPSTGSSVFCLRYLPGQGFLNPKTVPRYSLTLRASDDNSQASIVMDVHINPNSPPFFEPDLNINRKLSQDKSVRISAKDLDKDALTFSMVTFPPVDGLRIDATANANPEYMDALISPTKDLQSLCRSTVSALIYVKDEYHSTLGGPLAITLEIDKFNYGPFITNLNTDLCVRENEPIGTVVLQFATFDDTPPNTDLSYTLTTSPASAYNLFLIDDKNNNLVVKNEIDYETYPNGITLGIKVTDGICESETYQLKVDVVDINEPPTLRPTDQTVNSCEGKVEIRPRWTNVSDPDVGDIVRFIDISPNTNGNFRIDEKTGVVFTTVDYDLDDDRVITKREEFTITVADRQGEKATAKLTVLFEDCNDNPPVFSEPAKDYMVRDCWKAEHVVGNVEPATDKDSSFRQNNVFAYSGSAPGVQVLDSGAIVLQQSFKAGHTVTFPVYATDRGQVPGPLKSKPLWVSLFTLPCLPPPTTIDPTDIDGLGGRGSRYRFRLRVRGLLDGDNDTSFWGADGPNLGWAIAAILLALPLLALPCFLLWRYRARLQRCWANRRPCCPPKQREIALRPASPVRRPTPPPENQGPGFIFGWWKETYRDNDYERSPNRTNLPEPSKGPEPLETNTYDLIEQEPPPVMAATPPPPRKSTCHIM